MEKQRYALVKRNYLVPFVLVTSLFFLWGFAHAILDVLNKHFQEVLDITRTYSAMVQVLFYLGYFVMAVPAGLFITKYGYRRGVVLGLLLYGVGSLMFVPGEYWMSFEFFLLSLFVIACGLVFLETAANPYMTELGDRETAASRLNLAQSFNGLGKHKPDIIVPEIEAIRTERLYHLFSRIKLPEIVHADEVTERGGKQGLWSHKLFVFGVFALFCYEVAEISINSFFINYVVDDGWMNARDASVLLSFGGLGLFMCGRFVGSWVMRFIRAERVLLCCAVGTVFATLLVICNLGHISLVALFFVYAFEAIMFPTIFAISLKGLGNHTKRASSYLMMSPIGGAIGPVLMGYVADNSNMSLSFIVPFVAFCVVLFYSLRAEHESIEQ